MKKNLGLIIIIFILITSCGKKMILCTKDKILKY